MATGLEVSRPRSHRREDRPSHVALRAPRELVPAALLALSAVIWIASLRPISWPSIGDTGLIGLLPLPLVVAPALLSVGFFLALRQNARAPLLLLFVLTLIVMLYGLAPAVEASARNEVTWRHAGITDVLLRTARIDPSINAYFNWPGFFALAAEVTGLAGFASPLSLGRWAAVFNNVSYVAPLMLAMRSLTTDRRLMWTGVWFFFLTNWIDQDYFSPQGSAFFLYVCLLGLVLTWFPAPSAPAGSAPPARALPRLLWRIRNVPDTDRSTVLDRATRDRLRGPIFVLVVGLFIAMTPSHQLTPYAGLMAVTALVLVNRCSARWLPLVFAIALLTWLTFMAVPYVDGHLRQLLGDVGDVSKSASANVGERVGGTPGHVLVVRMRILLTGSLLLLAAAGLWRRYRAGHRDVAAAVLVAAPAPLFLLQPYGGEVLLRIALLGLPFSAFLAAAAFFPSRSVRLSNLRTALLAGSCALLLIGFGFSRYGNERTNTFPPGELYGVDQLYSVAPPGSLLVVGSSHTPWQYMAYDGYRYRLVTGTYKPGMDANALVAQLRTKLDNEGANDSYLFLSETQRAYVDLLRPMPPHIYHEFEQAVSTAPGFRTVWRDGNAQLLVYTPTGG